MLSIPKYPEQYAQHFPTIFYLLCCASQHHVSPDAHGVVAESSSANKDRLPDVYGPHKREHRDTIEGLVDPIFTSLGNEVQCLPSPKTSASHCLSLAGNTWPCATRSC